MGRPLKVIIDFDGTLTAEETQVASLAGKSLDTLANEIVGAPRQALAADYETTRARLLRTPHRYWWEVNGLIASYCDEGAFILNTTTLQVMLRENPAYAQAVAAAFPPGGPAPPGLLSGTGSDRCRRLAAGGGGRYLLAARRAAVDDGYTVLSPPHAVHPRLVRRGRGRSPSGLRPRRPGRPAGDAGCFASRRRVNSGQGQRPALSGTKGSGQACRRAPSLLNRR